MLRVFDLALTTAAATAAAAAGAHAAGAPLTSEILRNAAVGGALKSGAMAFAGLIMLVPQNTPFIILPMLLGTTMATNVLLVAEIANRTLGYAFRVPITFTSIPFDVLGAYTLVKMADNLGYPICPPKPAMAAGAVFGTIFSVGLTLLGCFVIGKGRTIYEDGPSSHGTVYTSCCGNRAYVNIHMTEYYGGVGAHGSMSSDTFGTIYNRAHALGIYWDPGAVNGGLVLQATSSHSDLSTQSYGSSTMIRMIRNLAQVSDERREPA
ncbi:hypothetical protein B0J18DRAFT_465113 [Chaetomium sp. MPI-SDFR-AT-0129]|nr:hypothetical protein B0J18DRAFT_465113 [Chaetomium sp. MPI-SDFR-AT-0129]